jgi:hypothetical protein
MGFGRWHVIWKDYFVNSRARSTIYRRPRLYIGFTCTLYALHCLIIVKEVFTMMTRIRLRQLGELTNSMNVSNNSPTRLEVVTTPDYIFAISLYHSLFILYLQNSNYKLLEAR